MDECSIPDVPLACHEADDVESSVCSTASDSTPKHTSANHLNLHGKSKDESVSNSSSSNESEDLLSGSFGGEKHLSGSLQDLVESFDQKVNSALKDMSEGTSQIAPVQVRSQEEIMSESQLWWTLTGNYGNLLPIEFNKTQIRKTQIEALNLQSPKEGSFSDAGFEERPEDDEEEVEELRRTLDFHQLVSEGSHIPDDGEQPPVTADQVIEEIDEMLMMQTGDSSMNQSLAPTHRTTESSVDSMYSSSIRSPFSASQADSEFKQRHNAALSVSEDELSSLPQSKLMTLCAEMEQLIQVYNTELVNELAHRDEQEYEKELKNRFITLLVDIQDRRRKHHSEKKRRSFKLTLDPTPASSQLLTATIPYDEAQIQPLRVPTLEALIKILQAISDDSPQVPSLLTDYILTVVCPSTSTSMVI